jgi:hypothetical protein
MPVQIHDFTSVDYYAFILTPSNSGNFHSPASRREGENQKRTGSSSEMEG